jgi:L-fuconolactonase
MTRVDAHHHIWDLSVREQGWMAGPELEPIRRNFSIEDLAPQAAAADVTATTWSRVWSAGLTWPLPTWPTR